MSDEITTSVAIPRQNAFKISEKKIALAFGQALAASAHNLFLNHKSKFNVFRHIYGIFEFFFGVFIEVGKEFIADMRARMYDYTRPYLLKQNGNKVVCIDSQIVSPIKLGRHISDGEYSGESFYINHIRSHLLAGDGVDIDLGGIPSSSWIEGLAEAIVNSGMTLDEIKFKIKIICKYEFEHMEFWKAIVFFYICHNKFD